MAGSLDGMRCPKASDDFSTRPSMNPGRKKILFLIPFFTAGGAERVLLILLRHLDRRFFEPQLGLLQAKGEFIADIPKDVVVHELKVSRVRYAVPRIVGLVWNIRPHTILSTLGHLNLALMLSTRFLPRGTRLLIRESTTAKTSFSKEMRHPKVWEWFYRHLYKRADRIVCLSDSMLYDLVDHFAIPREKLVRIYNPVDIDRMRELAERGGNPYFGSGPHLVAAGRLSREKGFDVLLDAMPPLLERFPNAQLTLLGDGPGRADLTDQAKRLGLTEKVHLLGFRPNPWPYFKYADLFVLPSRYEGMPNVLVEALVLGVPAVATDCSGGIREIAEFSPCVLLVPSENVDSLAHALISKCTAPRDFGEQAEKSKDLLSRFGLQRILTEYSSLLSN